MPTIIGQIGKINSKSYGKRKSNLIQIITHDRKSAFVEFRNELKDLSDKFTEKDHIKAEYTYDGKVSKSGQHYNNLIGISIEKL